MVNYDLKHSTYNFHSTNNLLFIDIFVSLLRRRENLTDNPGLITLKIELHHSTVY